MQRWRRLVADGLLWGNEMIIRVVTGMWTAIEALLPGPHLWTNQLQIGERNWGREKLELLERFSQERAQWEQRLREATAQQGKV